jgi:hypothetical protein
MKANKISKIQYTSAAKAVTPIQEALFGIKNITDEILGSNGSVSSFRELLEKTGAGHQAIVNSGQAQYDNRDQKLIFSMAEVSMKIPARIDMLYKDLSARIAEYEGKAKELEKQGFSHGEIVKICPPISQADIDLVETQKAELQAEGDAIQKYLNDAPEYREELLPRYLVRDYKEYQAILDREDA